MLLVFACLLLAGCAGTLAHNQGLRLLADGRDEEALGKFEEAVQAEPDNVEYRLRFKTAKERAVARLMDSAQAERAAGRPDTAYQYYQRVRAIEPGHSQAAAGLTSLVEARRLDEELAKGRAAVEAGRLDEAMRIVAAVLRRHPTDAQAHALQQDVEKRLGHADAAVPILGAAMRRSVSIEVRDASIKQLIEVISRDTEINFILDREIQPNLTVTAFLRNVPVEDALDVILSTYQLQRRVLNANTLLIYPNTSGKLSEFQDLVVKGVYLANASASDALAMLKSVLKIKYAHVNDKLNLLILREPPDIIRLAERLVAMLDVGEPEVMLEVEVLEVARSRLTELGIKFPEQLTLSPLPSSGAAVTLRDLQHLDSGSTAASLSPAVVNLKREVGDSNLLANPRIRARSKEKAYIKIGDRVPLITTTTTATGLVSENVQYVDVGLKLEVEPTVYLDDEVAIKLDLEVSSVVKQLVSPTGSVSYQIGTRNAGTLIRLKDGETQILGGLISDEDRQTANRVPGLGDLPVLGRLFSSQKNDANKTELILSITPRLVRGVLPPGHVATEFWSGTEATARIRPLHAIAPVSADARAGGATGPAPDTASKPVTSAPPGRDAKATRTVVTVQWAGAPSTRVGELTTLEVRAQSTGPVKAVPLQIKYDPALLEFVEAAPTAAVGQESFKVGSIPASGLLFVTQDRKLEPGDIPSPVTSITFRAIKQAERTTVALLPTTPSGENGETLSATAPALFGIGIQP